MTGTTLAEALLIRPGSRLWFSPTEWLRILGPLPSGVRLTGEFAAATVAVVFVSNAASVRWFLNQHRTVMALPAVVWMCYPAHGRPDLNRASLLTMLAGHSLHPVTEVAIDASWAAMRLRPMAKAR
jgi:hypothetical protein